MIYTASMTMIYKTVARSVEQVHRSSCRLALGGGTVGCGCPPKFRARQPDGTRQLFDSLETAIESTAATSWLTVASALEPFAQAAAVGRVELRPGVRQQYLSALRNNVIPHIGDRRIDQLDRAVLTGLADTLVQLGAAASTISNAFIALRALHRWAWERGLAGEAESLPSVRLPNGERNVRSRSMRPPEAALRVELLGSWSFPLAAVVYGLALWAGLRRGEIAGLRWNDINFECNEIRVERSYSYSTGTEGPPKSKAGTRKVPMPPKLAGVLRDVDLHRTQVEPITDGVPVVGRFHPGRLQANANEVWQRAGLEPLGLHEARHCYASMLIAAGMNIKQVSTYMGHASVNITLDRYAHLMPDDTDTAVRQLEKAGL